MKGKRLLALVCALLTAAIFIAFSGCGISKVDPVQRADATTVETIQNSTTQTMTTKQTTTAKPATITQKPIKRTTTSGTTAKTTQKTKDTARASGGEAKENQEYNGRTVYITPTGSKYHYANPCGRGSYSAVTLSQALAMDLEPCGKCVLH